MTSDDRIRRTQLDYFRLRAANLTPGEKLEYWKNLFSRGEIDREEFIRELDFPQLDLARADRLATAQIMEEYVAGDDSAEPNPYMNLDETSSEARRRAKRYLEWAAKCDAMRGAS